MAVLGRAIELVSNGYSLSTAEDRLGPLAATDPSRSLGELREQYEAQGYLWLKEILERKAVLAFRGRFLAAFEAAGIPLGVAIDERTAASRDPADAHRVLHEIVRWAEYEAFCLMQPIRRFYERFLEGAPYLHKRKLIRYSTPGDRHCTGAHYDLIYLRGGTDRICTSWIPIGEVPIECGGLVYLEGSDRWGRAKEAEFSARNRDLAPEERISAYNKNMKTGWLSKDLASLADTLRARWLVADFEAGDMVVHSPYMVHASTMNVDPRGRVRVSTDIRYQRVRDEIDVRWSNHWSLDDML